MKKRIIRNVQSEFMSRFTICYDFSMDDDALKSKMDEQTIRIVLVLHPSGESEFIVWTDHSLIGDFVVRHHSEKIRSFKKTIEAMKES